MWPPEETEQDAAENVLASRMAPPTSGSQPFTDSVAELDNYPNIITGKRQDSKV